MISDPHWQMIKGMFTTERKIVQFVIIHQELVCEYFLCCVINRFAIAINKCKIYFAYYTESFISRFAEANPTYIRYCFGFSKLNAKKLASPCQPIRK